MHVTATGGTQLEPQQHMRRTDVVVLWVLLGAAFVAILNETTMGVAISHLIDDLGITATLAQWLTTAFMLTMAIVIPATGFLLQRLTTRTVFLLAMGLFSAGTALALVAPGFVVLVVARVVQASGTAMMMPLLMTTLMRVVPAHERGRMMGLVSMVIALAPAIGPSLSGFVLQVGTWRWIFAIMLPIALLSLAIGWRFMRNIGEPSHARIDALSVVLSALGFGGLVFGLSEFGNAEGDGAAAGTALVAAVIALAVGVVALGLFSWRQLILQRDDRALLDLRVFRSSNFSLSVAQFAVLSMAFFGTITVLPLFAQRAMELDSLTTGLVVLPGAVLMGLAGPIIGRIYDASGTRVLLIPGAILTAATLGALSLLDQSTPVWLLATLQTVLSVGLALSFTPLFTAALASVQPQLYSHGSAIVSTVQQVAGAAGISIMMALMTVTHDGAIANGAGEMTAWSDGARTAFLFAAIVAVPTIVGAMLIRKPADAPAGAPVMH